MLSDYIISLFAGRDIIDFGFYTGGVFASSTRLRDVCRCIGIETSRNHIAYLTENNWCDIHRIHSLSSLAITNLPLRQKSLSNVALFTTIFQCIEFEQCLQILSAVANIADTLIIVDDIFNESKSDTISRCAGISSGSSPMQAVHNSHNFFTLLEKSGWHVETKYYFHGVRYANGIITAKYL